MNKNELKKILKPLIKECIKEVIFEDGTLSTIISEVAVGLGGQSQPKPKIVENKPDPKIMEQRRKKDLERRRKILNAVGKDAYNGVDLFEGTSPMDKGPTPGSKQAPGPLSGTDPSDPGVDLSNFMGSSHAWKRIIGN